MAEVRVSEARTMKEQQVQEIKAKIEKAQAIVLVEYKGINVLQDTALRAKCREAGVEYKVLKNRLFKKALDELGITGFDAALEETTAFAFGYDDCIAPCKVIAEQAKDIKVLKVKCGLIDGAYADTTMVEALSKIPPRDTLLSQLVFMLQNPMASFARAIQAVADKAE